MATNQTPVYGLNQWELSDSVVMADFNADNAKLEQALLDTKTKFQTGSYVGTGTYGQDNPNMITFDFRPKLVIIVPEPISLGTHQCLTNGESASPLIAIEGAATFSMSFDDGIYNSSYYNSALINLFWENTTIRWYSNESNAHTQYNSENLTYRYLAIG